MARFTILQSFLIGLLIYAFHIGALQHVYEADQTKLVVFISAVFLIWPHENRIGLTGSVINW